MNTDIKANYQCVYKNRIGFGQCGRCCWSISCRPISIRPTIFAWSLSWRTLPPSGCVTARAAGVPVVDANGDRYEAPHEANLFDMNAKYADVMSEQEALDYIASQKLNATAGAVPSKASRLRGTS